ncbi:hypothetical protein DF185_10860 [Marinifilum breve]|uniref:Uncharacterized protein n=1 Tax=Marinifilum breve TaxID=2184082 RepID=A0A2V3ZY23_9BACT|nr:hypothetical protein DF185_10860 [Marinifilum breve]
MKFRGVYVLHIGGSDENTSTFHNLKITSDENPKGVCVTHRGLGRKYKHISQFKNHLGRISEGGKCYTEGARMKIQAHFTIWKSPRMKILETCLKHLQALRENTNVSML